MQDTITVAAAAKMVGKHKTTLNRQIEAGNLKAQMDNHRQYRVDVASLLALYTPVEEQPKAKKPAAKEQGDETAKFQAQTAKYIAQIELANAQIEDIERDKARATENAEQIQIIATERQHRIEDQRQVMLLQQSNIDNQKITIGEQAKQISNLKTVADNAVQHARALAKENASLHARRWWQLR